MPATDSSGLVISIVISLFLF